MIQEPCPETVAYRSVAGENSPATLLGSWPFYISKNMEEAVSLLNIPLPLRSSRTVGWVIVDAQGIVADANEFFERLVGRTEVVGTSWKDFFDAAERARELPEAHRILAHAEGEHRAEVSWSLPPHFSVELDLFYGALDRGNGALYGPVLVMVLPSGLNRSRDHLRRLLQGSSWVRYEDLKNLVKSILEPLTEAQRVFGDLRKSLPTKDSTPGPCERLGAALQKIRQTLERASTEFDAVAHEKVVPEEGSLHEAPQGGCQGLMARIRRLQKSWNLR
jgi:hypothetical protein